eukprot:CAMPEP_0194213426 /NCGR_PEP_ID=MMETSP0156-20130528/14020_1 /TAXON_ID=33649 /ORGANISM="Thalassionema nitzschioides, Strain L26-B" /LENGTH=304 /DNA_ID=CAMNT_0038941447 /DNA_START=359 /DNA_END=1273 /DNA_ORIENTATION=-
MTSQQMQIVNLLSGGIAGTVSSILTNPLEVVKTQLQASSKTNKNLAAITRDIWNNSGRRPGPSGFFRGLPPTLVGIIPARSIYFYTYNWYSSHTGMVGTPGSPTNALLSGLLAGLTSNTLTNPIWMVRTRMQLYATPLLKTVTDIWCNDGGIRGFYKGITASYWGCTEGALQFVLYEQWKRQWLLSKQQQQQQNDGATAELSKWDYFLSAALSKALASIITYPHEVARTRMRETFVATAAAASSSSAAGGMWHCLSTIAKTEGVSGLYAGMGVHLVKVVPNSAFMFLTYEMVRSWLQNHVQVVD